MHRVVYAFICIVSLSIGYFGGQSSWPAKVEIQEQSEGDLNAFEQAMELHRVLEAICQVESNCDSNAIGDAGDAIGPFQIHHAYWYDAVEFSSDPYLTTGEYHDCFDYEYAYLIVLEYMNRYASDALDPVDAEKIARIHNGGPKGHKKQSTQKYWQKVKSVLGNS